MSGILSAIKATFTADTAPLRHGVDDSKGIADEVKHYIFIYYDKEKLPEVEEIENMINKQKQKGPWELHHSVGEFTDFELVVARKYNEA